MRAVIIDKSNAFYLIVTDNAKKTTTVNKIKASNKMATAYSGIFACSNTRATTSQAKEPEFLPTVKIITMDTINLIGSICSIVGLIIAIFLTTQIVSIKNKLTDNSLNKVKQEKNKVKKGDIAGRDVNK